MDFFRFSSPLPTLSPERFARGEGAEFRAYGLRLGPSPPFVPDPPSYPARSPASARVQVEVNGVRQPELFGGASISHNRQGSFYVLGLPFALVYGRVFIAWRQLGQDVLELAVRDLQGAPPPPGPPHQQLRQQEERDWGSHQV